ncbi:MAG: HAD hydrolase family protein [Cloacibacillus sp.]
MIKLFAMDVDGTLTDGGIYMDGRGGELKRFDVQDGQGIAELLKAGVKVVFVSGRMSAPTQQRALNLKITECLTGVSDKAKCLKELAAKWSFSPEEVAYAGDDTPDADAIRWAGIGFAVANARPCVKEAADVVTEKSGGYGAIRECVEYIKKYNGESN